MTGVTPPSEAWSAECGYGEHYDCDRCGCPCHPSTPGLPWEVAKDEARARIASFLDGWSMMGDKTDLIYGVGVRNEDTTRDLLASDLRLLLGKASQETGESRG